MKRYEFLNQTADLDGKEIKFHRQFDFNGEIIVIIVTKDDKILAKLYSLGSSYGSDYVCEKIVETIEELFARLDHELIDILITEDEYEILLREEAERDNLEEQKRLDWDKKRKYEQYLKLKKEFE